MEHVTKKDTDGTEEMYEYCPSTCMSTGFKGRRSQIYSD